MTAFAETDVADLEALITSDFPCAATISDPARKGDYAPIAGFAAGTEPSKAIVVSVPYEWRRKDRDGVLNQQTRMACVVRGQDLTGDWEPKRGMQLAILGKTVSLVEVIPYAVPTDPARIAFYELVWGA